MAKKKRGLALVDPERRKEISRKGNAAARAAGKIHRFTPEEARNATHRARHPEDAIFENLTERLRNLGQEPEES